MKLDHRRVFDLRLGGGLFLLLLDDLDILARRLHVLEQVLQTLIIGAGIVLFDERAQRVLAGDDREEVEPGDELEIFEEAEIAGIGHGDGERAALALERQHDTLGGHVGRDQLEDLGVDLEAGKVDGRHAILPRQHLGNLQLRDQPQLDQDVAQAVFRRLLLGQCLGKLLPGKHPVAKQHFAKPIGAASGRCGCHGLVESL